MTTVLPGLNADCPRLLTTGVVGVKPLVTGLSGLRVDGGKLLAADPLTLGLDNRDPPANRSVFPAGSMLDTGRLLVLFGGSRSSSPSTAEPPMPIDRSLSSASSTSDWSSESSSIQGLAMAGSFLNAHDGLARPLPLPDSLAFSSSQMVISGLLNLYAIELMTYYCIALSSAFWGSIPH